MRATIFVVVGIAIVGLAAGGIAGAYYGTHLTVVPHDARTGASVGGAASSPRDYLYLVIATDPATGFDAYLPANFTVPAHVPIVVTITNYDNGTNAVSDANARVRGTIDGAMTVLGEGTVTRLAASGVSHTFTIEGVPGGAINVPVPPATDAAHPAVVTFTIRFDAPGTFTWMCYAPCDENSMGLPGRMAGLVTVA